MQGGTLAGYSGPVIDPRAFYQNTLPIQQYDEHQAELEAMQAINAGGPLPMSPGLKDERGMVHIWNAAMARHGHAHYKNCDMDGNEDVDAWFGKAPGYVVETKAAEVNITKAVKNDSPQAREARLKEQAQHRAALAAQNIPQAAAAPPVAPDGQPAEGKIEITGTVSQAFLHPNFAGLFSFNDLDPMEAAYKAGELE